MVLDQGGSPIFSTPPEEAATLGRLSAHLLLHALCSSKFGLLTCQYGSVVTRIRLQAMAC